MVTLSKCNYASSMPHYSHCPSHLVFVGRTHVPAWSNRLSSPTPLWTLGACIPNPVRLSFYISFYSVLSEMKDNNNSCSCPYWWFEVPVPDNWSIWEMALDLQRFACRKGETCMDSLMCYATYTGPMQVYPSYHYALHTPVIGCLLNASHPWTRKGLYIWANPKYP